MPIAAPPSYSVDRRPRETCRPARTRSVGSRLRRQQLLALLERHAAQVVAVAIQQVEGVVQQERPRLAGAVLQQLERRAAAARRGRRSRRRGRRPGTAGARSASTSHGYSSEQSSPRREARLHLAVLDGGDDAIAVQLGLEQPVRVRERPSAQRRQHRRQHLAAARRAARPGASAGSSSSDVLRAASGSRPAFRSSIVRPGQHRASSARTSCLGSAKLSSFLRNSQSLSCGVDQRPAAAQLAAVQKDRQLALLDALADQRLGALRGRSTARPRFSSGA